MAVQFVPEYLKEYVKRKGSRQNRLGLGSTGLQGEGESAGGGAAGGRLFSTSSIASPF